MLFAVAVITPNPVAVGTSAADNVLRATVRKAFVPEFTLDVSITVPPGITIIFGTSGAGKTSLLNCIAGLWRPDRGRISIGNRTLFDSDAQLNVPVERRRVGYVFQRLELFPHLTAAQNVEYGLGALASPERRTRAEAILQSFRIAHLSRRKPGEISGGERQRVALARALVTDPCILLLDEPLTGLDASTRSSLLDDLRAWNDAHRVPVLYVTHSREELFAVGERIVVLEQGKVAAHGLPRDILEAPGLPMPQPADCENIFGAAVIGIFEREGTMICELSGGSSGATTPHLQVEVPVVAARVGDAVQIAISAGDILLATARPEAISARNVLAGRIAGLRRSERTCIVEVDCGAMFLVHVTPAAVEALSLTARRDVWLIFKTHSCHIVNGTQLPK